VPKYRDYRSIFPLTIPEARRLLACFERGPNDCWLWTGPLNKNGYGRVYLRGSWWLAHRMIHELLVGPVPPDRVTHHRCRNKRCSNPEHLKATTNSVNVAEEYAARGSDQPRRLKSCCRNGHKFTEDNILWRRDRGKPTRICRICHEAASRRRNETRRARRAAAAPLRSSADPAAGIALHGGEGSAPSHLSHFSHSSHLRPEAAPAAEGAMVGVESREVPRPSTPTAGIRQNSGHFAPPGTQAAEPLYRRPSHPEGDGVEV